MIAVLANLPGLRAPLWLDDFMQISMIEGTYPAPRHPLDLYDFVSDDDRAALVERGLVPWWAHPKLRIRFLRPLSSALLYAAHRVLGGQPALMHVHSIAWWFLAVLAARALFKRLGARAAAIATIVFALAPCHVIPLGWIANREVIVSLALGTFALGAYVRWRELPRFRDGAAALLLFALALAGGEYALCFGGYVLAIELTRRDSIARRVAGVTPFALPSAMYLAARSALHYGTVGSGFYRDPFVDPWAYAATAPKRLATLLADAWLTMDAEEWLPKQSGWIVALFALGLAAVMAVPLRRVIRALAAGPRRDATWMLAGSVFALAPLLSVAPSGRTIAIGVLGVAGVVAVVIEHAWFSGAPQERRGAAELTGLVALMLGFAHFVHAPVSAWLAARFFRRSAVEFSTREAWLHDRLAGRTDAEVLIMRANWQTMMFGPFAIEADGRPPWRWRVLAHTGHVLVLRRDARTLEVVAPKGWGMFPTGPDDLFRSIDAPMVTGETKNVPGMRATVLEAGESGPYRVRFEFERDLDEPSVTWISEERGGYKEATPPAIGFGAPFDP